MSLEFPRGYDPMGRDPSATTIRTPMAVDVPDDEIPEVPSPDVPTMREVAGSVPDDVWPEPSIDPSPMPARATGPVVPLDVRPDASDRLIIYRFEVLNPVLILNRDHTRRRALIIANPGVPPVALSVHHQEPNDRNDIGFPLPYTGGSQPALEVFTWGELWCWAATIHAEPVPVAVLIESDHDQLPRGSIR